MNEYRKKYQRFVGLDVHAATIAVAVAERDGEVRSLGVVANTEQSIRKLVKKLNGPGNWKACYEAGPTGYVLYWQLVKLGVECMVIAPTLVPVKAGDRVKTDRRDAERLARGLRAGDLTAVFVPDAEHEALRDLVRARESAKQDQLRARHRLGKFLLRHGRRPKEKMQNWTQKHLEWIRREVKFEQQADQVVLEEYLEEVHHQGSRVARLEKSIEETIERAPEEIQEVVAALQALKGVAKLTAVSIVAEVGSFSRFASARDFMGYSGSIPSEYSSGERRRTGGITKTGNAHLRRVLCEAAWCQWREPVLNARVRKRQEGLSPRVIEIATTARYRLHARFLSLLQKGKPKQQVVTAVARELCGFIWAIGREVEQRRLREGGSEKLVG